MKRLLLLIQTLFLVLGIALAASAAAEIQQKGIVINPNSKFSGSIWTDRTEYRIGDSVRINFRTDVDGYVVIYDLTSDGRSTVVWPRSGIPKWCTANRTYSLPDGDYTFNVVEPTGPETLVLVVSRDRNQVDFEWNAKLPFWQGLSAKLQIAPSESWSSGHCSFTVLPLYTRPQLRVSGASDARVFLDGRDMGYGPVTVDIERGRHQLIAIAAGMQAEIRDFSVYDNTGTVDVYLRFDPIR